MHKILKNISGLKLASLLKRYNYRIARQTGSHIRLVSNYNNDEHKITILAHNPIKIGTLNNILKDISDYLGISKENLITKLFDDNYGRE